MGGGLLQLIAVGQIDQFLSANPELSFYQYVYKRHSPFAMESRQLTFETNPILSPSVVANNYKCEIIRYGDLLGELYFCFTLPDIYSSDRYRFRWVPNIGHVFIKKASVFIDDSILLDQTTGDWMTIWNELTQCCDDKHGTMIGNVPELQTPKLNVSRVSIKNNRFIYYYYPESFKDKNNPPSINSRKIVVPLNFWFTKNPSLALPLLRLQLSRVSVRIDIESSESLYQVWAASLNRYVSPMYYNELYGDSIDINTFTKNISLQPYIEANYVFLGEDERNTLFMKSKLTYMVEQLSINTPQSIASTTNASHNVNIMVNNPTKEIIWTLRRDDYWKYNEFDNYSPSIPESSDDILDKAVIKFNNNDRFQEKSAEYFNMIQPYQHHSKVPKKGIYCYSFAIYPEKEFISGYYNAALVKTNLLIYTKSTYNNDTINTLLTSTGKQGYNFNYLINVYSVNYNVFEIVGGQAGMKFTISK
jgi:hypothetical protein